MDVSEARFLRFHDDHFHRSLNPTRGAIYSQGERGNYLIIVVGIIMMFMLAFFAANTNCGYGSSSVSSDDSVSPSEPQRREEMEANLFSDNVAVTLKQRYDDSSAMVFKPRQPAKDEECPICCNNFLPDEAYCIVKTCNHLFHRVCIEHWIIDREKDICPVCRSKVIAGDYACKEIEMTSSQEENQPNT